MARYNHKRRPALILLSVFCMVFVCFSGCASTEKHPASPTRIADHLFEVTYADDFDWEAGKALDLTGYSCSGVQNGQYRGRNYDWIYADTDICVLHAAATENRPHASVGVADLSFTIGDDSKYNYTLAPFATVDGINDAGVCVQTNVMPYGEDGALRHTETEADDLPGAHVLRSILDYADSVEDALVLLLGKDIHPEIGTSEVLHWMISGPASRTDDSLKTVVAEVFPDGLRVTEDFADGKPIITNFCVADFDGTAESVGIGQGYERWQILNENFSQASSVMGTFDLMEKVYFSKMYDLYGDRFWYSEYNGVNLSDYCGADVLTDVLGKEKYNYYMDTYGGVYYTTALWDGDTAIHGVIEKTGVIAPIVGKITELYNAQSMEDGLLWITVHTSVYDLENLTLHLQVRESQEHLRFTIDG